MIIKAKPLPGIVFFPLLRMVVWFFRRRLNKMVIDPIPIRPGHSYILMCNHFSFLDGILACYLCLNSIHSEQKLKRIHIMSLKKQIRMKPWLRYAGSFSVEPGRRSVKESLDHAAELLSEPGNLLLLYPQGNLESAHVRTIEFKQGIAEIIYRIKGDCQLIWSSNITEYFESVKPSVYFNMLDCGTNHDFDFEKLKTGVNRHHRRSIARNIRFTEEQGL